MTVILTGSIKSMQSRIDASGDVVQKLVLEVFGPVEKINKILKCPLTITLETDEGVPIEKEEF